MGAALGLRIPIGILEAVPRGDTNEKDINDILNSDNPKKTAKEKRSKGDITYKVNSFKVKLVMPLILKYS